MSGPGHERGQRAEAEQHVDIESTQRSLADPYDMASRAQSDELLGRAMCIDPAYTPNASAAGQAAELRRLETEERGTPVGRYARVYQAQPFLILRRSRNPRRIVSAENLSSPDAARQQAQGDELTRDLLQVHDRVLVVARYSGNWVKVRTDDGTVGFVDESRLMIGPPHPDAELHRVESGETALGIAKRYYDCSEWGRDARFYTNVLEHLNNGAATGERAGFYKADESADWADTQLRAGYWVWIPPKDFADRLHGVLPSGSISYELVGAARDTAAFTVGCLAGAVQAVTDIVMDVVELFGLLWDAVGSIVDGTLADDLAGFIGELANIDIGQLLGAFADHWNASDPWEKWYNRGEIIGLVAATVIIEVLLAVFTGGAANAARWASKASKLGRLMDWVKASRFGRGLMGQAENIADAKPDLDKLQDLTKPRRQRDRSPDRSRDGDREHQTDPPTPPRFALRDVDDLMLSSEGRPGVSVKKNGTRPVGHSGDHVPLDGASIDEVRALSMKRPHKLNTTVYLDRTHAKRDLRNVLNANADAIDAMKPGDRLSLSGSSVNYRRGYNSVQGADPDLVEWQDVTVSLERLDDGTLHLAHFSPSDFLPIVQD